MSTPEPTRRVLVAHPSPDLYGSDRQLLESVEAMVDAGWRVRVVLPDEGPLGELLEERGAHVLTSTFPVLRKALLTPRGLVTLALAAAPALLRLRTLVRLSRADVLYVNTVTIPLWLAAGRLARVPVVCHAHEAEEEQPRAIRAAMAAPMLLAHAVVANSAAAKGALARAFPLLRPRIEVVHNGVPDSGQPRAPLERAPWARPVRLALVSRLSPRKGVDVALEALGELRRQGVDAMLDVCGTTFPGYEWYEEQLRDRADREDLAGAVTFHGYVSPTRPVLDEADIVLVPSRLEPFGNTAVEGLLAERTVVASRIQGLREVIQDGHTGVLVEPGSAPALAEAISALVAEPERAAGLARAGRADALARFSVERYRTRIADVLHRAWSAPSSRSPRSPRRRNR
ncbi:glycosyltransferase family 4 protein [Georgenia sp. 10Sc9-8]|uniref:Glycosyltransferase family 4 protein n=1 Tax=Georgenia halotolerans TaxID=3028317 RepID=A0ABT5TVA1_9MICO|nr:glycosyltransferase family 4 protein [Georgenia halotolerans]